MKRPTAIIAILTLALPLWAHEGEDHSAPATPAPIVQAGVRTEAQTEAFELVAVLAKSTLVLYLDAFGTNEPVADAQVEVESGAFRVVATRIAPGLFAIPGAYFGPPGRYPLVISVQAGEVVDLLTATLEVAQPFAVAEPTQVWAAWREPTTMAGGAGVLVLAGIVVAWRRQRRVRTQAGTAETDTRG